MCLITRQICPIKAKKDIVCYKELMRIPKTTSTTFDEAFEISKHTKSREKRPKYMTPYQGYPIYDIPTRLETQDKTDFRKVINSKLYYEVHGGMFHAYTTTKRFPFYTAHVKIKCIIPKGTLYFKGMNDSICAKTLILQEII